MPHTTNQLMYKYLILICLLVTANVSSYAQDYFEQLGEKQGSMQFAQRMSTGIASFDFGSISDRTLVVPEYHPKSLYHNLLETDPYADLKGQAARADRYRNLQESALAQSLFDLCPYQIGGVTYEALTPEMRQKYLFLSYKKLMNYYYLVLWYVDEAGEAYPASMILANDLDFGSVLDLRLAYNLLAQTIEVNREFVNKQLFDDIADNLLDDARPKMDRLISMNTEDVQTAQNDFYARQVMNYLSEAEQSTLLIPQEAQSRKVEKAIEDWTYSPYEFQSQADIDLKRQQNTPGYAYLRVQQPGRGMMAFTMAYILSTQNDRILYMYMERGSGDELHKLIPDLIDDIEDKRKQFDPNSTIIYTGVVFEEEATLPVSLSQSSLGFVSLTEDQYTYAKAVNRRFEKEMKDYPYALKIVDDVKGLKSCRYRVLLKSFSRTYRGVKHT